MVLAMPIPEFRELPGTRLTPGIFAIARDEDQQVRRITQAAASSAETAHPLWAYIATQRGIGTSVAELCALGGFDVNDGPMLGSVELAYHAPLTFGETYSVEGEVLDIIRKEGRSGVFDIMTYRERLIAADATVVATATNSFILPRRPTS